MSSKPSVPRTSTFLNRFNKSERFRGKRIISLLFKPVVKVEKGESPRSTYNQLLRKLGDLNIKKRLRKRRGMLNKQLILSRPKMTTVRTLQSYREQGRKGLFTINLHLN